MTLTGDTFRRVADPAQTQPPLRSRASGVHAVAGIGNPERFFAQLRSLRIAATTTRFPVIIASSPAISRCPGPGRS
jgi:tetraacyldisaccharide-1-P 4'-kinase